MLDLREPLLDPDEDPRVEAALVALASALQAPPDELTARRHRNAIAAANGHLGQTLLRRTATATAVAAVLAVLLAFAGALPENAQRIAADLASRVGLMLPRPAEDVLPPTGTGEVGADTSSDADRSAEAQDAARDGGAGIAGTDGDGRFDADLPLLGRPAGGVREGQLAEDVRSGQRAAEVLEVVPGLGPVVDVPAGPPADRPVEPAAPGTTSDAATGGRPSPPGQDGSATGGDRPATGSPGQPTVPAPGPGTSTGSTPSDPTPSDPEPDDTGEVDPPPATDEPDGSEVSDPEPSSDATPTPPRRPIERANLGRSADHLP
jgi:hypothetical protein